MELSIIYIIYLILSCIVVGIMVGSETMFFAQQNSYRVKSIFNLLFDKLKENILNAFMCVIIMVCMLILNIDCIYFIVPYLVVEVCLWLWAGNQFEYISKLKFTKRIIRQFVFYIILVIIFSILIIKINFYYLSICFPLMFFVFYILYFVDLIMLSPVEKLIGRYYFKKAKEKLSKNTKLIKIGITGSYGKTSTKEILYSILSNEFYVLATPKSFNTPFGISKTINEELKNSHEIFICEMGAKKQGEINELCKLVNVDCGIVTSVGRQHLETFGSVEGVYKTKKELPDFLYQKFCVFNLMNNYVANMFREYLYTKIGVFILPKRLGSIKINFKINLQKIILNKKHYHKAYKYYEFVKGNNVYAKKLKITSLNSKFQIWRGYEFICEVESELIGLHNVINILLATAMALMLGVNYKSIMLGVKNIVNIKARFEKTLNANGATIINNGYNSNLDSAVYSLKAMNLFDNKNKLVVTPGLIECKDMYEDNYKFGKLVGKYATEVIVVKKTNREAIVEGLKSIGFNKSKIYLVEDFDGVKKVLENVTKDYVVLIENDLPENYK